MKDQRLLSNIRLICIEYTVEVLWRSRTYTLSPISAWVPFSEKRDVRDEGPVSDIPVVFLFEWWVYRKFGSVWKIRRGEKVEPEIAVCSNSLNQRVCFEGKQPPPKVAFKTIIFVMAM